MWEIDREQRIKLRAERYAKGEIDLKTFFDLESLDEIIDEAGDLTGLAEADSQRITPNPEPFNAEGTPRKSHNKTPKLTKEEFDKLSLQEQNELYNENPEGIEALIKGEH